MPREMLTKATLVSHDIVGAFYRPPAKAILNILPLGAPLILRPEPTNPFDPNVIAILIRTKDIPQIDDTNPTSALALSLAESGHTVQELRLQEEWHLGYIRAIVAKDIHLSSEIEGAASFGPRGGARVQFSLPSQCLLDIDDKYVRSV